MTVDIMIRLYLSIAVMDINLFLCYELQTKTVGLWYTVSYTK